jgi:catechol 2,3-dioxygenase-like lactoylglutathione lyase family enzyme
MLLTGVLSLGERVTAQASLPLANLGIEHLDIVVPDPAASAHFYARIFRTPLHQQPVRDTLRYFMLLGDLPADRQVGYVAIGATQGRAPAIGHYCVLAKEYARDAFSAALRSAGLPSQATAPGPIGMWPDPDGLELQLFQPPAGLVAAAVTSPLPVEGGASSRRRASITCCSRYRTWRGRSRTIARSTAGQLNVRATRTDVCGFSWSAGLVWGWSRRPAPPALRTTRSVSRRSTATRS